MAQQNFAATVAVVVVVVVVVVVIAVVAVVASASAASSVFVAADAFVFPLQIMVFGVGSHGMLAGLDSLAVVVVVVVAAAVDIFVETFVVLIAEI